MILRLLVFLSFCLSAFTQLPGQSLAHVRSAYSIIDPSYSTERPTPPDNILENQPSWIYGTGKFEPWRLQLLMQRKDSAKLKVGYPGVYHVPAHQASFAINLQPGITKNSISFRATGEGNLLINGEAIATFSQKMDFQTIQFEQPILLESIQFDIQAPEGLPALLIKEEALSTSLQDWQWKTVDNQWESVTYFPQNTQNLPPHLLEDPDLTVKPVSLKDHLYDFGRELYGHIFIKSETMPALYIGESATEALDIQNTVLEQTTEVIPVQTGLWKSKVPLAFRYVYVEDHSFEDVYCEAIFYPATYQGAFACSDSLLNQIWMNSTYTLRLCMHDFMLDGIKRDRLSWTGDLAMSLLVNAYTFGDAELVRRSLVALGRAGIAEKDINGIVDYSLWWIIAQDLYQIYYQDPDHLAREWPRIQATLDVLESEAVPPVGTPYMAGFEMMARARLGNISYTLDKINDYWGGMMERGATSFWEAYDPQQTGKEQYAYYRRPYAKSLCHARSTGPAAILPSQILGVRPLEDGWRSFMLQPNLGTSEWVNTCIPTPFGKITVDIEKGNIIVKIPEGTELIWGNKKIKGPNNYSG